VTFCFQGTRLRRAASLPVFTRLLASESLLFAWPKRSNQEKGHPDTAVCGHPALRLRNATPEVRRQSIPGLASNWARSLALTLRAFPPSRRRCIGGPHTAHPAQQRQSDLSRPCVLCFALAIPSPAWREKVPKADEGLWLCPSPCGPAALVAPLLRRSGHARERHSLAGRRVKTGRDAALRKSVLSDRQSPTQPTPSRIRRRANPIIAKLPKAQTGRLAILSAFARSSRQQPGNPP
jgi:hypothetical protein